MWQLVLVFGLKLVSLAGATLQTVGVIALFGFEWFKSFEPWRWHMIIGGTLLILAAEGLAYGLARWAAGDTTGDSDPDNSST